MKTFRTTTVWSVERGLEYRCMLEFMFGKVYK